MDDQIWITTGGSRIWLDGAKVFVRNEHVGRTTHFPITRMTNSPHIEEKEGKYMVLMQEGLLYKTNLGSYAARDVANTLVEAIKKKIIEVRQKGTKI